MKPYLLCDRKTFAISAENPTGAKNGGTRGKDCEKLNSNINIKPGETAVLVDIDGPGIVQHFWMTGYYGHNFILRMYWENSEYPSVEAPLSAFFGCAYDDNLGDRDGNYISFSSSMMSVTPSRGYNSYFEMPFHKHCKITVENRGEYVWNLYYMFTGCFCELPENIGYFHASYRQEHPVTKGAAYTVIDGIKGKGQFMGVTFAAGINGRSTCWVEGETKMYIDGDQYPSVNYTGTEDYFCGSYAFGNDKELRKYQTFEGLHVGMYAILGNTSELYNNQQRFLLYRFHDADPIYFEKDFRMTIDNFDYVSGPRYDDFTSVAYWYQTLPSAPLKPLPSDRELIMK